MWLFYVLQSLDSTDRGSIQREARSTAFSFEGGVDDKNKTWVFTNTFVLFLVKLLHLKVKNTSMGFSDLGSVNTWHRTQRAKYKMRFLIQNGINQLVHAELIWRWDHSSVTPPHAGIFIICGLLIQESKSLCHADVPQTWSPGDSPLHIISICTVAQLHNILWDSVCLLVLFFFGGEPVLTGSHQLKSIPSRSTFSALVHFCLDETLREWIFKNRKTAAAAHFTRANYSACIFI